MEAVAHNPSFAKKAGIPQSVGKDFSTADKGKTFKRGGDMATMDPKMMAMKSAKRRGASMAPTGMAGMGGMGMKKGGMTMAAFEKSGKDVEKKGVKEGSKADMAMDKKQMAAMKKGGMTKKYASGGAISSSTSSSDTAKGVKTVSMDYDTTKGKTTKGGSASSRSDGVAQRGKTKGKNFGNDGPKMPTNTKR